MSAIRVLFLGNSHTYYHDMPDMVVELAEAAGVALQSESVTGSGVDLAFHWNHRRSRQALSSGDHDVVVLQDRSGGPLEAPDSLQRHGRLLVREAQRNGARPLLYQTWARRTRAETQARITRCYDELAAASGAEVAPVGEIWQAVLREGEAPRLHDPDDRHAGPIGSYLAALTFMACITGRSPVGLPTTLERQGQVWVSVDEGRGRVMQTVVEQQVLSAS